MIKEKRTSLNIAFLSGKSQSNLNFITLIQKLFSRCINFNNVFNNVVMNTSLVMFKVSRAVKALERFLWLNQPTMMNF